MNIVGGKCFTENFIYQANVQTVDCLNGIYLGANKRPWKQSFFLKHIQQNINSMSLSSYENTKSTPT